MPRKPKSEDGKMTVRMVVMVGKDLKVRYSAMCKAIGENPSEHARQTWETELALYEASKGAG